jgi:hypothetical protein
MQMTEKREAVSPTRTETRRNTSGAVAARQLNNERVVDA